MASIKETATAYLPRQSRNIAELPAVSVDLPIMEGVGTNSKDGKDFTYHYVEVGGEEFRVPDKVLKDLKAIFQIKPNLKSFRVMREGTGLSTNYTVIPVD